MEELEIVVLVASGSGVPLMVGKVEVCIGLLVISGRIADEGNVEADIVLVIGI